MSRESETDDQSRANTPSINLDTTERLKKDVLSQQEEGNREDASDILLYSEGERQHNHNSRVTFLLT